MCAYLGEKTSFACAIPIIVAANQSKDWKERCMGFTYLGMISEACQKQFKSGLEDVAKMSVSGFSSEYPRVRYEAL